MTNPFALNQIKNGFIKSVIQKLSKIDTLEHWYNEFLAENGGKPHQTDDFITKTLKKLGVRHETVDGEVLNSIPRKGAFIIVANHPLGGLEGLILTQILRRKRPDLKVLTNEMLSAIPELSEVFIGVDVLNQGREKYNAKGMRDVARHLSGGGALLVFPAGTVSRIHLPSFRISDAPWSNMISRLVRKYDAPVMPIFVEGRNSLLFYLSAFIHKRLRTLLLPRAMMGKTGETIRLHIGQLIPARDIKRLRDDDIAMDYIRLCCKMMSIKPQNNIHGGHDEMNDIKGDVCTSLMINHLQNLEEFCLYENDDFSLYCAPYDRLGPVMEQLSIERERTFRGVDEGSGKEVDSDQFDPHYMHLFLWDKTAHKIAGGYRLGKTDKIVKTLGLEGLYSHSLFDYKKDFLDDMGQTIEVGRSFVAQEYQKNPVALDMLWKGIGHYVAENPDYHTLFGCVSISRQYSNLASAMLTETFLAHYGVKDSIARRVKARTPLKHIKSPWTSDQLAHLSEIPIVNKLVGRIDPGKSVPVLIRHYLALNGKFISFTVNDGFNDALDGLIMVDLRNAPGRYLKRYMGPSGMSNFVAHHNDAARSYSKKN